MKIKIDKADRIFSQYVREIADWTCQRCRRKYDRDEPNHLQASHFYGRGNENTRFMPDNVDALCMGCHMRWGGADHESYREFKVKQLGEKGFQLLTLAAHTYCKKDRKLAYMVWKQEYLKICKEKRITPKKI